MKFQYVPEGEWINGIPLPLTTDGHPDGPDQPQDSEDEAHRIVCEYLSSLTANELARVQWVGVRRYMIDDEGNGESTGRARLIDPSSFEFID